MNMGYSNDAINPAMRKSRYTVWSARATSLPGRRYWKPEVGPLPVGLELVGGLRTGGTMLPGTGGVTMPGGPTIGGTLGDGITGAPPGWAGASAGPVAGGS